MTGIVPLVDADEEELYGAKAVGLGDALRAGLPVPPESPCPGLRSTRSLPARSLPRPPCVTPCENSDAAGRAVVRCGRGQRRGQLRRTAHHRAERAVG